MTGAPRSLRITRRERLGMISLLRKRVEGARRLGQTLRYDEAIADDLQRLDAAVGAAVAALDIAPEDVRATAWWQKHGADALKICAYYRNDVTRVAR